MKDRPPLDEGDSVGQADRELLGQNDLGLGLGLGLGRGGGLLGPDHRGLGLSCTLGLRGRRHCAQGLAGSLELDLLLDLLDLDGDRDLCVLLGSDNGYRDLVGVDDGDDGPADGYSDPADGHSDLGGHRLRDLTGLGESGGLDVDDGHLDDDGRLDDDDRGLDDDDGRLDDDGVLDDGRESHLESGDLGLDDGGDVEFDLGHDDGGDVNFDLVLDGNSVDDYLFLVFLQGSTGSVRESIEERSNQLSISTRSGPVHSLDIDPSAAFEVDEERIQNL